MHKARHLINSILVVWLLFLEASNMALVWDRVEGMVQFWNDKTQNLLIPVSLGKGSSSISSDVSSSTDHTPTQAQKNVATSEGRHLVFILFPSLHSAGYFWKTKKMCESQFCSAEWEQMQVLKMRGQRVSQVLFCCAAVIVRWHCFDGISVC